MRPRRDRDAAAGKLTGGCVSLQAYHDPTQGGFSVAVCVPMAMLVTSDESIGVLMIMNLDIVVHVSMCVPQIILQIGRDGGCALRYSRRTLFPIAASSDGCETDKEENSVFHANSLLFDQGSTVHSGRFAGQKSTIFRVGAASSLVCCSDVRKQLPSPSAITM